ncbi:unnamed protein product [Pleuronectes platessa]|uniref:Uncharacterized protein n=1 Tax=Pleuronectes platessa TaxID=8262 RepID=A0A9N7ZBV1_PLEPL|nr:unnamed protein product [Pleuronectes platessa]
MLEIFLAMVSTEVSTGGDKWRIRVISESVTPQANTSLQASPNYPGSVSRRTLASRLDSKPPHQCDSHTGWKVWSEQLLVLCVWMWQINQQVNSCWRLHPS